MKKIFAISVLSVMAVVGTTNAWADTPLRNYNLATVNYVEDIRDSLENNIYNNMVQKSYVAESGDTVSDTGKDTYIPTVARMEAAIANDTSGLVEKAQVITSDGFDMNGDELSDDLTPDEIVPTLANVEENFAPRIGDEVYYYGESNEEIDSSDPSSLPQGEYSVIVSVDGNGNVSFRWVPIQTTDCTSTVGYTCPPS